MSPSQNQPTSASPKKWYEKPYLQIYGDLAEITNDVSSVAGLTHDGGANPHSRTH